MPLPLLPVLLRLHLPRHPLLQLQARMQVATQVLVILLLPLTTTAACPSRPLAYLLALAPPTSTSLTITYRFVVARIPLLLLLSRLLQLPLHAPASPFSRVKTPSLIWKHYSASYVNRTERRSYFSIAITWRPALRALTSYVVNTTGLSVAPSAVRLSSLVARYFIEHVRTSIHVYSFRYISSSAFSSPSRSIFSFPFLQI